MRIRINELRRAIRRVILESYEADEDYYDNTVLPDDEAESSLLGEPDLTDQKERDDYVDTREKKRKKKVRLKSAEETYESMGDEASMVGGGAGVGGSIRGHVGGAWGPRKKSKRLKSKNAMGTRIAEQSTNTHAKEPYEGYVQEGADMYAQDDDYDGYVEFGKKFGYSEEQLGEWFDVEYEKHYQAWVASQDSSPPKVGSLDLEQLDRDFESGYVDLKKRPYQLD